jgi:hypothetical protein
MDDPSANMFFGMSNAHGTSWAAAGALRFVGIIAAALRPRLRQRISVPPETGLSLLMFAVERSLRQHVFQNRPGLTGAPVPSAAEFIFAALGPRLRQRISVPPIVTDGPTPPNVRLWAIPPPATLFRITQRSQSGLPAAAEGARAVPADPQALRIPGRAKKKVAPWPGRPSAQTRPPWRRMIRRTTARPIP